MTTVVMPVRNERRSIERALRSVLRQDYPHEAMEVIVADGMSEDGTREAVAAIADQHPDVDLRVIDNPRRVTPAALNAAIAASKGDVIVRVDGHCELAPNYVRRCVAILDETGADNVGGVQRAVGEGWIARVVAVATTSPFGVGNARFRYAADRRWVDTVYLGAYRREVFDRVGGFDEELTNNQDDELNLRLRRAGGRILLDPSIKVSYTPRDSLGALWRQYFRYGLFKVRVMQKVGGFTAWRHYVPAAFVASVVCGAVVAVLTSRPVVAAVVPAVYVVALVAASVWSARRCLATLPLLPVAFGVLHVAYGTGFLWGLWRWRAGFRSASAP